MVVPEVAITAFIDKGRFFVDEVNQMTLSGKDLDSRFVFVIFAEPEIVGKIKKRDNVLIYEYESPKNSYYEKYRFAKSLEFLKSNEHILGQYKYLIKTDSDVFLTKNLNSHTFNEKILFNKGYYSETEKCVQQTYNLAKMFGYENYKRNFQPHSTFIGPAKDIIDLMNLSDILCKEIFYYLCPDGNYGETIEETWTKSLYAGTSTMIATEIVISSIFSEDRLQYSDKIDSDCFSDDSLEGILHIHQWHGERVYSKYRAREGFYDYIDYANPDTISGYCLSMFLENKKEKNV